MKTREQFTTALKNLREKIVDKGVFGAEEGLELVDLIADSADVNVAPVVPPTVAPPDTGTVA